MINEQITQKTQSRLSAAVCLGVALFSASGQIIAGNNLEDQADKHYSLQRQPSSR